MSIRRPSPRVRVSRHAMLAVTIAACLLGARPCAQAASSDSIGDSGEGDLENTIAAAKAARNGAGLRVGAWGVRDLPEVEGARYSKSPSYEGYFQKGLDSHLVIESTLGLWRWVQEIEEEEGGALSSGGREVVTTYLVPAFSAIKFYPLTRPGQVLEPYAKAGAGFVLGIEDAESTGSGPLLGFTPGTGTSVATGFGLSGAIGVDWAFSRAFGLTAGGRYQWMRFSSDVGGQDTFKGVGVDVGLTYRFRY